MFSLPHSTTAGRTYDSVPLRSCFWPRTLDIYSPSLLLTPLSVFSSACCKICGKITFSAYLLTSAFFAYSVPNVYDILATGVGAAWFALASSWVLLRETSNPLRLSPITLGRSEPVTYTGDRLNQKPVRWSFLSQVPGFMPAQGVSS